jgi:hypothetical protein
MTCLLIFSCAGPTSPFGASIVPGDKDAKELNNNIQRAMAKVDEVSIESIPKHKIYHQNFNLSFIVKNKNGLREPFQYNIVYNGEIVFRWLKSEEIIFNKDKTEAKVIFKNLSLLPGLRNEISFLYYDKDNHAPMYYDLGEPECSYKDIERLTHLSPFTEKEYLIKEINSIAKNNTLNPILLASLVAQESSFKRKAVSIARAVGLTQVTPIADSDIRMIDPSFKSYPDSKKLSYLDLKYKIFRGIINEKNDWRLNEKQSLRGGAIYLGHLVNYWNNEYNKDFLDKNLKAHKTTDIVLASYNSGASRVKRNIGKHKDKWIWSNELGEARKYVNNIKSYCHQFNK